MSGSREAERPGIELLYTRPQALRPHPLVSRNACTADVRPSRRIDGQKTLTYKRRKIYGLGASTRPGDGFGREAAARPSDQRSFNREADLSTEQAGAQAPSRFPRAHRDERRPQGHPGAP